VKVRSILVILLGMLFPDFNATLCV
jgi:hypothetical protein